MSWLFDIFKYSKLRNPSNDFNSRFRISLYDRSKFCRFDEFNRIPKPLSDESDRWHLERFKCTSMPKFSRLSILKEFKLKSRTLTSFATFSGKLHLKLNPSHWQWAGQCVRQPLVYSKHDVLLLYLHVDSSSWLGQSVNPLQKTPTEMQLPSSHWNCVILHGSLSAY